MSRRLSSPNLVQAPQQLGAHLAVSDPAQREALERAAQEAYAQGLADGMASASAQAVAAAARAADALRAALEEGLAVLRAHHAASAAEAVQLALQIAHAVLGREVGDGGATVLARLQAVLATVDEERVTVAVAPEDVEVVAAALAEQAGVAVREDPRLDPGEARVTGRWANVDLTRSALLEAVRASLAEQVGELAE